MQPIKVTTATGTNIPSVLAAHEKATADKNRNEACGESRIRASRVEGLEWVCSMRVSCSESPRPCGQACWSRNGNLTSDGCGSGLQKYSKYGGAGWYVSVAPGSSLYGHSVEGVLVLCSM